MEPRKRAVEKESREAGRGVSETKRVSRGPALSEEKESTRQRKRASLQLISASSSMAVMTDRGGTGSALAASEQHTHAG